MRLLKKESVYHSIRLAFVVIVILYSVLRQNVTAIQPYLMHDGLNVFIMLAAGILVAWDVLFFRNLFKMKYIWLLIAFFALTLVSVALNTHYGIIDNLKAAVNLFIQFFALYVVGASCSRERLNRDFRVIGNVLCAVWGIAAAISVYMYFADIFYYQNRYLWDETVEIVQGFVREHHGSTVMRLWGVFVDPNFAAGISIAVLYISLYIVLTAKNKLEVVLHAANIVFQFLYVVLSNSRMALLILCLTAAVGGWYYSWIFVRKIRQHWLIKEGLCLLMAFVMIFVCYFGIQATKTVLPYVKYSISQSSILNPAEPTDATQDDSMQATEPTKPHTVESLERGDAAVKEDVSNGRFALWFEGIRVFAKHPVFGVGPRNYHSAAVEVVPDSSIAGGLSIHNSFIELLMGNGIVGFVLMLGFFILCAKDVIVIRYRREQICAEGALMLAVLGLLACGVFIACLFYTLSGATIIMFAILGYAVKLVNHQDKH